MKDALLYIFSGCVFEIFGDSAFNRKNLFVDNVESFIALDTV